MQIRTPLGIACVALLAAPATAYATDFDLPDTFSTATGVLTLLLAIALLVVSLKLRKVSDGSAIAGNITYVMAGSLCLATSVLVGFVERLYASLLSAVQVRMAVDLLVFMAMLFLTLYFDGIRRALMGFLRSASEPEPRVATDEGSAQEGGASA